MKKNILAMVAGCFVMLTAAAQIPNNGFENWTNMGNYNEPDQWGTLNSMTSVAGVYTCVKGTPGNPGASYIKLTSKNVASLGVAPGIAVSGTINTSTFQATNGFPYNQQATALTGKWQYMASGNDQGYIAVYLTKWNSTTSMRDTVSKTVYNLPGMVMSWASFSIPLTYQITAAPDTAMIVLSASSANGVTPEANSYLYVDDLAFATPAGINEQSAVENMEVYPNPASDKVSLKINMKQREQVVVRLVDIAGKIVKETNAGELIGENEISLETKDLRAGAYLVEVKTGKTTEVKRVMIRR